MNLLQERFNQNPPDEIVKEFPIGSGIKHIPIRDIKRLLNENFIKWKTSKLRIKYIQRGHDFIISGSVKLTVYLDSSSDQLDTYQKYSFIGANTFNVKTEQAEGNNENYEAILLANALKNACKNLGNLFGGSLNSIDEYLPNYEETPFVEGKKESNQSVRKTIKTIIKKQI